MKQHDLMPTFINGDRIILKVISPNDETEIQKIVTFHQDNSRFIDRYIGSSHFKKYNAAKIFITEITYDNILISLEKTQKKLSSVVLISCSI